MNIHLPSHICANIRHALSREWLVTNGHGGFAAGTVAGALTRRYHGLLIAGLKPPAGRTLLVAKLDDTVFLDGTPYQLYTNIWKNGLEQPTACRHLQHFDLTLGLPTWTFCCDAARLRKRVWMEHRQDVTYVQYELLPDSPPVELLCRLLVNDRHYHFLAPGGERAFRVRGDKTQLEIATPDTHSTLRAMCHGSPATNAAWQVNYTWCHDFHLPVEQDRGFDHLDSNLVAGLCKVALTADAPVTFVLSAGDGLPKDIDGALSRRTARAKRLLSTWEAYQPSQATSAPPPVRQLVLSADQFVVTRRTRHYEQEHTVIAGYPWFTDWGRDTMVALPGLTLVTGRHDIAREILLTWSRYVDQGMIPNRFPDSGDEPEYHTADATLWYLWAIDQYVRATGDIETLAELFPVMRDIVAWHRRGTRHNIHVAADGLVHAGEHGINLTWMDAKIGSRVVTPRHGKPVELSALWYDGLCNMARLADLLDEPADEFMALAQHTRHAFQRFWNEPRGCCFDVIDGPHGHDNHIRCNQIFAASLTHSALDYRQQDGIVQMCVNNMHTWFGLRTLAPFEPGYRPHYHGDPVARDEAYHQGTAWGWLLGPFVLAHFRVRRDAAAARRMLEPMLGQLWSTGIGSLSEIFDGEAPYAANGCFAQAWSVAETLRAWFVTQADAGTCRIS